MVSRELPKQLSFLVLLDHLLQFASLVPCLAPSLELSLPFLCFSCVDLLQSIFVDLIAMSVQSLVQENWQTTKATIKERCTFLFNNDMLSDVKLIAPAVTSTESESKKAKRVISAHKFILSICSPVFYTMFNGELPETGDSVEVLDCEFETLLEFVRFLYSDEVTLTGSNVLQVLYLAKKYMVPSLADKCREFLEESLYPKDVFSVLPVAELHEDKKLLDHCWKLIDRQTKVALESAESIERSVLEALVERDTLNIKEIDLFAAVSRWATNECGKQGLEAGGKVKRRVLGDRVVKAIRFPLMTEKEFTSVVVNSEILSAEEVSEMNQYFKTESSHLVGFSKKARRYSSLSDLLRCHRFTGGYYGTGTWSYRGSPDSLLFEVDEDIKLHGVYLFGKDNNNYSVDLEVIDNSDKSLLLSQTGNFTSEPVHDWKVGDYEGFQFLFDTPIDIEKNTKYRVKALISGPPSMRGQGRYGGTGWSGVQFTFFYDEDHANNRTNHKKGQFPEFVFTKCEQ